MTAPPPPVVAVVAAVPIIVIIDLLPPPRSKIPHTLTAETSLPPLSPLPLPLPTTLPPTAAMEVVADGGKWGSADFRRPRRRHSFR